MQAILYRAPGEPGVAGLDEPVPTSGTVLVRTAACGLCHTDIDVLHGRYGPGRFPLVPGHEYAGTVEAVGDGVTSVAVGDRVVVDPNIACGVCRACGRGLTNLCDELRAYGVTENGGFAEASVVKAENVHPIGDMPFGVAALAEPLACTLNGVRAVDTANAADALVFGAGPIGMLMALALKDAGVDTVRVVDIDDARLDFVESSGLEPVPAASAALESLRRANDVVVDATGVPAVAEGLIEYGANGASVLFFGVCPPESRIRLSPFEIFRRQIRLAGAHSLNRNVPEALEVLRRSGDTMQRVVSHRLGLEDIVPFLTGGHGAQSKGMKVQYVAE